MGDFGKGLKNFKQNIKDEHKSENAMNGKETEPKTIDATATEIIKEQTKKAKAEK